MVSPIPAASPNISVFPLRIAIAIPVTSIFTAATTDTESPVIVAIIDVERVVTPIDMFVNHACISGPVEVNLIMETANDSILCPNTTTPFPIVIHATPIAWIPSARSIIPVPKAPPTIPPKAERPSSFKSVDTIMSAFSCNPSKCI